MLPRLLDRGHQALAVIERHQEGNRYLVGDAWPIADIALYAYTHVAHEGGFDLSAYPAINAWLERARGQAGYVGIGT